MINQLKNDLAQLKQEKETMQTRAQIYAECGLEKKAEEFASIAEKDEKLIKAYEKKIKQLNEKDNGNS